MEGGACSTGANCCNSPPSNKTLYCDTDNPNPGSGLPGTCRNSVPIGAACTVGGVNCSTGYSCTSTASGYRCIASAVSQVLPSGWLVVGDAQFGVNAISPHSGSTALDMNTSGFPDSYIYDNALVLNNSTVYYVEFWVNRTDGPVRYAIYDVNNDAYLGSTGEWVASPRNAQGYESSVILSAPTANLSYTRFGRSFYTLSKNVSHVQLRIYPPADGSRAFVDDMSVTEVYDFTLLGWIRAGYPQTNGAVLFSQMGTEDSIPQGLNWTLNSTNWLRMGVYSSDGGSIAPVLNLSDLDMHMFALTVYRSGNYSAYLDGSLVSTSSFSLGRLNNTGSFYIGSAGASGAAFKGVLDEVRLYRRALSASEIAAQYAGYYQSMCLVDMNVSYANVSGLSAKDLSANYNAILRLRKLLPETVLSMPFDANVSSDLSGAIPDHSRSLSFGTKTGATWTSAGKIGGAYSFLASTDKIQLSGPLVSGTADFTLSAWIYPTSSSSHVEYIMGNYGSGNPQGVKFYAYQNVLGVSAGSDVVSSSASSIQPNTWFHVAATRRNGDVKLYINGEQDGNGTVSTSIGANSNFAIGNGPDYFTENFMGTIDEARVFSKALSADEVRALYNDTGLTFYGPLSASTGAACPGGSSSLCAKSMMSYLPSRCGFLGQICCVSYGSYTCSGAGVFCNTSLSPPMCNACGNTGQVCCTGNTCTSTSLTCSSGTCQCGAINQPCCLTASGTYNCSLSTLGCNMTASPVPICQTCGGANQTCCANSNCSSGYTCVSGSCQCGGPLQKCCGGTTCTPGLNLTCNATTGYCQLPCGVATAQCCWPGNTCNSTALACYDGFCNCGTIGMVCCSGNTCNAPTYAYCNTTSALCQHCGNLAESCCTGNGNSCNTTALLGCNSTSVRCQLCGNASQICCANSTCNSGFTCNNTTTTCVSCGGSGQPCCASSTCNSGYSCNTTSSLCQACGNASQLCCAGNNCTQAGYACNISYSPQAICQSCGALSGQLCCYNQTSLSFNNCTNSSLTCNTTATPPICYVGAVACGGSGQPCCGESGSTPYYAWRSVDSSGLNGPTSGSYIMGYNFTVNTTGTVTELCTNAAPAGTYTVKIWNTAYTELGSASVTVSSAGTWACTVLETPISLSAGQNYYVGACLSNYYYTATSTPRVSANGSSSVTIKNSLYFAASNCVLSGITGTPTSYMYGQADIKFAAGAAGTCDSGYTCSASTCVACGGSGQPCCNGTTCNSGYACNSTTLTCAACGGSGQPCCSNSTCNTGYTCNATSSRCQTCGVLSEQLCCRNTTSGLFTNCTNSSLTCNTTASPPVCYVPAAACGASGQACCGGSATSTNYPWRNVQSGSLNSAAWSYIMGYYFTAGANGTATELCTNAGSGTFTVKMWNTAFTELGSVSIASAGGTWACTALSTPITLVSGTNYYVGTCLAGGTGRYGSPTSAMPTLSSNGSANATLQYSFYYSTAGCTLSTPSGTATGSMYGQSDFKFQYGAAGTCNVGYTCNASSLCQACGASSQICCNGTTCNSGYICSSGTCAACGVSGQPCCTGDTCNTGYACNTTSSLCQTCGGIGQICCSGSTCTGNYTCTSGVCTSSTCTSNSDCAAGNYCAAGGACTAKKSTGGTCDYSITQTDSSTEANGVCSSGYCRDDYDSGDGGDGLCDGSSDQCWCASSSTACAHNAAEYSSGSVSTDCYDTYTRRLCSSGAWTTSACSAGYRCSSGSCVANLCGSGCTNCWCTQTYHSVCGAGTYCYTAGVACLPACGIGAGPYSNCMCGTSIVWWGSCYSSPPSC